MKATVLVSVCAVLACALLGWGSGRLIAGPSGAGPTGEVPFTQGGPGEATNSVATKAFTAMQPALSQLQQVLGAPLPLTARTVRPSETAPLATLPLPARVHYETLIRVPGRVAERHRCLADIEVVDGAYHFRNLNIDAQPLPAAVSCIWRRGEVLWSGADIDPAVNHLLQSLARRLVALDERLKAPAESELSWLQDADGRHLLIATASISEAQYRADPDLLDEIAVAGAEKSLRWQFFNRDDVSLQATCIVLHPYTPEGESQ